MKSKVWKRAVFLLLLIGAGLLGKSTTAQESRPSSFSEPVPLPQNLSLAEAKRIAFQNNWDLLAAKSQVDLATAQKIVSKELPNPTFSYSTQKINIDGRSPATPAGNGFWERDYDSFFAINQLFEIAGKRSNRQKSAEAGFAGAQARLEDSRRILDAGITKAYVEAALADAKAGILLQSGRSLRKEADLAGIRFQAGDISQADKEQIEIAAERFELDAKTAEANAKSLKTALEVLLGVKQPRGRLHLSDSLEALAKNLPSLKEGLSGDERPDLLAAEANVKKAEADLNLQKALRIPDPTFLVQYEHNPPDQPNTLGVGVSFPLPLFSHNAGEIRSAWVARDQAQRDLEKTKAQIAADVHTAELSYEEARRRAQQYRREVLPKSARILGAVTFAYEKGAVSYLDLLAAQRNDNDVKIANSQAEADAVESYANYKAALNLNESSESQPSTKDTR
ncbi:MAG: TolC family protein [bacterium]